MLTPGYALPLAKGRRLRGMGEVGRRALERGYWKRWKQGDEEDGDSESPVSSRGAHVANLIDLGALLPLCPTLCRQRYEWRLHPFSL
jgi:hypothetical protein